MSPNSIKNALGDISKSILQQKESKLWTSKSPTKDGYTIRYFNNLALFVVRFCKDRAVEISVNRDIASHASVLLYEMDVFTIKAENLVLNLKHYSSCIHDTDNELLSFEYLFPDIGIRLWREMVFHESLQLDREYMDKMGGIIDELKKYLYFDMLTVLPS